VNVAAEALYNLGEKEAAKTALLSVLKIPNEFARCHALNVIDCIEEDSPEIVEGVIQMIASAESKTRNKYDMRAAKWLIEKWNLNQDDYKFEFAW
jgi:HEAT repeat protein